MPAGDWEADAATLRDEDDDRWMESQIGLAIGPAAFEHTEFHDALNKYLRTASLPGGAIADMLPRKGRPGALIQTIFSLSERTFALTEFFKSYKGGAHLDDFIAEMNEALKRGLLT